MSAPAPSPAPVLAWALTGLLFTAFSAWVFAQWFGSTAAFVSVPVAAGDGMAAASLRALRAIEVVSTLVALGAFLYWLVLPWLRHGKPPLAGLLLIGALITYVLDTTVNYADYHMAWNQHSYNFGTWASFFPGHTGPTRYAEAWFWGPPMYVYFGVGLGSLQLALIDALQPRLGRLVALLLSFVAAFCFDLVVEPFIIQTSQAYAWPFTIGALSLWAGTQNQFPLYESLLVAIYASLYVAVLKSARDQGESFVERGAGALPSALRLPARLMAATGFAALCTSIYFGGFYLVSQHADSRVAMPSYLQYSDSGWTPPRQAQAADR